MINVLLVEDHELYRMGLSMLLSKAEDINLIAEACDGTEGVRKAREFAPQVILMDIGLPNMDGRRIFSLSSSQNHTCLECSQVKHCTITLEKN